MSALEEFSNAIDDLEIAIEGFIPRLEEVNELETGIDIAVERVINLTSKVEALISNDSAEQEVITDSSEIAPEIQ